MSTAYDAYLQKLLAAHTAKLGAAGEGRLVDTFFSFLRRHTSLLSTEAGILEVQAIAQIHADRALKEKQQQQTGAGDKPKPVAVMPDVPMAAAPAKVQPPTRATAVSSVPTEAPLAPGAAGALAASAAAVATQAARDADEIAAKAAAKAEEEAAAIAAAQEQAATQQQQQEEEEEEEVDPSLVAPNAGNGCAEPAHGYSWTQTLAEVSITIPLPAGARAKDCSFSVEGGSELAIAVCGRDIVVGTTFEPVAGDDCTWLIDTDAATGARSMVVFLAKRKRLSWWESVVVGHSRINVRAIPPENAKLADLDPASRETVEKMMREQQQKRQQQQQVRAAPGTSTSTSTGGDIAPGTALTDAERAAALEEFKRLHPEMDFSQARVM